jgi:DNA-directed RNA polymerase subunit beta'
MKTSDLEKIIYFQDYVVTDPGGSPLRLGQLLGEEEQPWGPKQSRRFW